jgi:ABC-type sugar transport system substrate-binding protein
MGVNGNGAVLQARGINKSFGAVQALKDVDFEVRPGEVVALIGDNGAGKSTLINVITGVLAPDSGEIIFEGERVEFISPHDARDDDPVKAASITTSTLQSNPDLKGIFGANVFSGQGAGTGLRQTGKKDQVSVVAFDASPTQVEDLRRGNVDVLIAQHPNDIGDSGVRIAVDYLESNKEPANKQITTGFTTVTRENLGKPEVQKYLYKAEC